MSTTASNDVSKGQAQQEQEQELIATLNEVSPPSRATRDKKHCDISCSTA